MSVPILWMPGISPLREATYSNIDLGMECLSSLILSRSRASWPHQERSREPPCLPAISETLEYLSRMSSVSCMSKNRADPASSGSLGTLIIAGSDSMTPLIRSSDFPSMYSRNSGSTRGSSLISRTAARHSSSVGKNRMLETRGCHGAR